MFLDHPNSSIRTVAAVNLLDVTSYSLAARKVLTEEAERGLGRSAISAEWALKEWTQSRTPGTADGDSRSNKSKADSRFWKNRVERAQRDKYYLINGKKYRRIPYGDEPCDYGADCSPCGGCTVVKGQFHVPGCGIEHCPRCLRQAIGCECDIDHEFYV
jgi:hypothetical protein